MKDLPICHYEIAQDQKINVSATGLEKDLVKPYFKGRETCNFLLKKDGL